MGSTVKVQILLLDKALLLSSLKCRGRFSLGTEAHGSMIVGFKIMHLLLDSLLNYSVADHLAKQRAKHLVSFVGDFFLNVCYFPA